MTGRKLFEVVAPENVNAANAANTKESPGLRHGVHKDGRKLVCQWFYEPVLDDDGRQIAILCFAIDMTERVRMELELKNRDHLLRVLLDNIEVVVWQVDPKGVFTFHDGKRGSQRSASRREPC